MKIINANAHGENYIFGVRNNMYFSFQDIETIYHISEKEHIHNVIIVTSSKKYIHSSIDVKIKDYNIEVWDNEKLYSLLNESNSTLKTSDTSDDNCEIEEDTSSPINETSKNIGLLDSLFDKPDKL